MKKDILTILTVSLVLAALAAQASTTLTVATTTDGTGTSPLTLRAALNEANNDSTSGHFPYIIKVPQGTYNLTEGELAVGEGVSTGLGNKVIILGTSTATTTIIHQSDGSSRVFLLDPYAVGDSTFSFGNVTISGGNDTYPDAYGLQGVGGGGILIGDDGNGGDSLMITNCILANNTSSGEAGGNEGGGAICSDGGKVFMVGCVVEDNTLASGADNSFLGAGVNFVGYSPGDNLTAINCAFLNNSISGNSEQESSGGAVALYAIQGGGPSTAKITNCVFGGNSVTSTAAGGPDLGGGAIYLGHASTADVIACTFTNNQANGNMNNGGAILSIEGTTNLIQYCRFIGNSVAAGGAGTDIHLNTPQGPFNANDNWWAANSGPPANAILSTSGPTDWLFLTNTASPSTVAFDGAATLTASFLKDSAGNSISAANLTAFTNVAISFGAANGSISSPQALIQSSGTATATFTGTVSGSGSGFATVDGVTSTASITVLTAVTSVSSSPTSHDYRAGQTVPISLLFSGVVNVTGTPQLALSDGGTASYTSGSGTSTLTFDYVVGASDTSSHLDYASTAALTLNGGTINANGVAATLTLPAPGAAGSLSANTDIVIDTTPPTVTITNEPASYSPTNSATFGFTASDSGSGLASVQYQVDGGTLANATSPITLVGLPDGSHTFTLQATDNAGNVGTAGYSWTVDTTPPSVVISAPSVTNTNSGSVSYTVTFSDTNLASTSLPALSVLTNTTGSASLTNIAVIPGTGTATTTNYTVILSGVAGNGTLGFTVLAGAAIDKAGNTSPSSTSATFTVFTPTVTSVSSSPSTYDYKAGSTVPITITFSGNVTVTGTPSLALNTGESASYVSGSDTSALTFDYVVSPGDTTSLLDYASSNALTLNGGSIIEDGVAAILTLPAPGTPGSLSANTTIIIDTTPPTVTITNEPPSYSPTNSATFGFTASDSGSGLATVQYQVDGGTLADATSPITLVGLPDGSHTFTLQATDNAGNVGTAGYSWTVDTTPPSVVISAPSVTDTNSGSVTYTVTFSDTNLAGTSLPALSVLTNTTGSASLTNIAVIPGTGTATTTNYAVILSGVAGNGTLGFTVPAGAAIDKAGNTSPSSTSATFTVFTPTVTSVSSSPSTYDYKAGSTVPITITFSGNVTVTGTPSLALNTGESASYVSGSDTSALTFDYVVSPGDTTSLLDYASSNALTLNGGSIIEDGVAAILTLPAPGTPGSLSANTTIIIDTTPPTVTITNEPPSYSPTNSATFGFTASDSGSGLATVQYQVDGGTLADATSPITLVGLPDGSHTFTLQATDNAGNVGTAGYSWTVDTTPPSVVISAPSVTDTNSGSVTYTVTFSDTNLASTSLPALSVLTNITGSASLTNIAVIPGTGTATTTNYTVTLSGVAGDGTLGFTVPAGAAIDKAGNTSPSSTSATFTVFTPAVISVSSSPSTYDYKAGGTVPITITFNGNVTVTGTPSLALNTGESASYVSGSDTSALTFDYVVSPGDTASLLDYASSNALTLNGGSIIEDDVAANLTLPAPGAPGSLSANATIIIDTTPPTVTLTNEPPSYSPTNSATFGFTASDSGSGLASVQYQVDGGTLASATSPLTLVGLPDGSHTFTLQATDNAGNVGTASYSWTVDTTPPSVVISTPSVTNTNSGSVTYTVTFSDTNLASTSLPALSVLTNITGSASLTNIAVIPGTGTATSTNYTVTLSGVAGDGTLGFTVPAGAAIDKAGNSSPSSTSATFTVFTTRPTLVGVRLQGNGVLQFTFTNNANASFTVLSTTNLSLPLTNWTVAGAPSNAGDGMFQFTSQPTSGEPHVFYIIRSP